ncbi:MAG: tetratricopeptide repeat protein [Desulfobacterales bacterium]|jgi:tetratricopeptide (TPR) repeat protein
MRSLQAVLVIIGIAILMMNPSARAQDVDWFDKGRGLLSTRQYDEAIKAFSTAIEIIPHDYQSYNLRGVTWALKGNYDQAIADYSKAIDIQPRYAKAYNNRGFAHTQMGNLKLALEDYTRALEINPFLVDAYNNKAWVLATCADQRIRDGGAAVRLAQKAMELKPDVSSMDTLAAAYAAAGDFQSAIETQRKAIQKLMLANKTEEVRIYLSRLKNYQSQQALLIDYTALPKPATAQNASASSAASDEKTPDVSTDTPNTVTAVKAPQPTTAASPEKGGETPSAPVTSAKPIVPVKTQTPKTTAKRSEPAVKESLAAPTGPAAAAKSVVPAKTQTAATNARLSKAAATKPPVATIKHLPYTIQVSAFRDPQRSIQVARKLNTKGDPAYTSPVNISGKGKWYRVYIGNYKDLADAKIAANDLKRRKFRYVNITKKPYAIQVGSVIPKNAVAKLETQLLSKGYCSYHLPAKANPNRIRVLIGAFENKQAATDLSTRLKKDGFDPKIVLR